jgi:hypothetical protein
MAGESERRSSSLMTLSTRSVVRGGDWDSDSREKSFNTDHALAAFDASESRRT